jgi:glycosyltransferase involved in cell wall biosynthesis
MRIGIDALGIEKASGGRTSVVSLLSALFKLDQKNSYIVAVSTYEPLFYTQAGNIFQWLLPVRNRFLRRIVAQILLPIRMRTCDLIHFTKNLSVFGLLPPYILTIHDLSMLKYPDLMAKSDLFYWKTLQSRAACSAARIITVSKNASSDIQKFYRINPDKIDVIYHGVDPIFSPVANHIQKVVLDKYHLPDEFLLHVGRIDPIKNLPSLVKAFALLKKHNQYAGKLVIVGEYYKKTPDYTLLPTINQLNLVSDVILPGYVAQEDLPAVYSAARLKIFPSHNEGFGLAPLEAMACGTPVIAYHAGGAVSEILGDSAIILNENDPESIYKAIFGILRDDDLREDLILKGLRHAKNYDWMESAQRTLSVYEKIVSEKSL